MQEPSKSTAAALTLMNPADGSILGELADAIWTEEKSRDGINYVLSGLASDGTLDTLQQFMGAGLDTVSYLYSHEGRDFRGEALLLRPAPVHGATGTEVRVETAVRPQ